MDELLTRDPDTVETIELHGDGREQLSYTHAQMFPTFIEYCKNIREFTMTGYYLDRSDWRNIMRSICTFCHNIQYLNVSNNWYSGLGLVCEPSVPYNALSLYTRYISFVFMPCLKTVHTLDLSNTWFSGGNCDGPYTVYTNARCMRLYLKQTKCLRVLKLDNCHFYPYFDACEIIVNGIEINEGLEIISVENTDFKNPYHMFAKLANNVTLRKVIGINLPYCQKFIKLKRDDIRTKILNKLELLDALLPPEMTLLVSQHMNLPVPYEI